MRQLTNGFAGSLSISVADHCFITCPKTKIKVILEYVEESWLGRAQNKVQGIIFTYDPSNDTKTRLKDVPADDVLGRIEGSWMDKVYYTLGKEPFNKAKEKVLLIDLNPLNPVPKIIPELDVQCRNESRRFWDGVTKAIVNKQYGLATTLKQELEEKQREKAKEREKSGKDWQVGLLPSSCVCMMLTCFEAAFLHRCCDASWPTRSYI